MVHRLIKLNQAFPQLNFTNKLNYTVHYQIQRTYEPNSLTKQKVIAVDQKSRAPAIQHGQSFIHCTVLTESVSILLVRRLVHPYLPTPTNREPANSNVRFYLSAKPPDRRLRAPTISLPHSSPSESVCQARA